MVGYQRNGYLWPAAGMKKSFRVEQAEKLGHSIKSGTAAIQHSGTDRDR